MSEHDHDEIARRLRESGTVPAPERLQGEVMDQVRAEPRLRPARRSVLMPVMPYAAAAALLAVLVLALSHLGGGSGGSASSSEGGGATAGGIPSRAVRRKVLGRSGRGLGTRQAKERKAEHSGTGGTCQGASGETGPPRS